MYMVYCIWKVPIVSTMSLLVRDIGNTFLHIRRKMNCFDIFPLWGVVHTKWWKTEPMGKQIVFPLRICWKHNTNIPMVVQREDSMIERKIALIFHATHWCVIWYNTFSSQKKKRWTDFPQERGLWFPMGGVGMHDSSLPWKH